MRARPNSALLLSLALITSACSSPMNKQPDIKLNPHPKMRYEITVTIEDAPGPFDSVQASAGYDVANDRCVPLTPGSGATITPEKSVPVVLSYTGDNVYKGMVYVDLLQDEDYYGLGVCHWKMTAVDVDLRVTKSVVSTSIFLKDLLSQKSNVRYFSNLNFTDTNLEGVDIGNAHREDFKEDANRTFSVKVTAQEDFQ